MVFHAQEGEFKSRPNEYKRESVRKVPARTAVVAWAARSTSIVNEVPTSPQWVSLLLFEDLSHDQRLFAARKIFREVYYVPLATYAWFALVSCWVLETNNPPPDPIDPYPCRMLIQPFTGRYQDDYEVTTLGNV